MANEDSHAYTWLRIKTLAASLLSEIVVITQPANPAKHCSVVPGGCHLTKSIEPMGLDNQANLPFDYNQGGVTKRNFNVI